MFLRAADIPGLTPHVDDTPDETPDLGDSAVEASADLIGVFVGIEYRHPQGHTTRRRISINAVTAHLLSAYCHERRAPRKFRIDRIVTFYDLDGVTLEPPEFFRAIRIGDDDFNIERRERPSTRSRLSAEWRNEIAILAALSSTDGFLHPSEVEEILQFVGISAEVDGFDYEDEDLDDLGQVIRRIKISEGDAIERLEAAARSKKWRYRGDRLIRAMHRVANADGLLHPAEFKFIERAERILKGA